jgi:hypothetical protein
MTKMRLATVAVLGAAAFMLLRPHPVRGAGDGGFQNYEYATIRWSGRLNTHVVRPDGSTESLGPLLSKIPRQEKIDDRSLCMTIALNAIAKEGYDLAAATADEIIVKRPVQK